MSRGDRARVGAVVLAAGGSTRLGTPKQLVAHEGTTLVVRAVRAARDAVDGPVVVVIGASAREVRAALTDEPAIVVEHARWADGMGTSLAAGIDALVDAVPSVHALLVTLVDQPDVTADVLGRLVAAWSGEPDAIVAARYAGIVGVPALFGRAHVAALRALPPDAGAARLLRDANRGVTLVDVPEAAADVDTPADLERLRTEAR